MKYALLIYTDPNSWEGLSEDEQADISRQYMEVGMEPGCLGGDQLQPTTTATTVRRPNGQTLTTDGPFAETREVFAGYYLFDVDNLDRALELAGRIPATWMGGSVEVRPIVER